MRVRRIQLHRGANNCATGAVARARTDPFTTGFEYWKRCFTFLARTMRSMYSWLCVVISSSLPCCPQLLAQTVEIPDAFSVVVDIDTEWFGSDGVLRESRGVRCVVVIENGQFFVRPFPRANCEGVALGSIGTSPFNRTNYLSALASPASGDFDWISVDAHPSKRISGFYAHLARIACVSHRVLVVAHEHKEWFLIPGESVPYRPEEVQVVYTLHDSPNGLPETLRVMSPAHLPILDRNASTGSRPFGGLPVRVLWEYSVDGWTTRDGITLPSEFTYVRYQDVSQRVEDETLVPIVRCKGSLVEVVPEALYSFRRLLANRLRVVDLRSMNQLGGKPLVYEITNGIVPSVDSSEVQHAKERYLRSQQQPTMPTDPSLARRKAATRILLVSGITLPPVAYLAVWLVQRRRKA